MPVIPSSTPSALFTTKVSELVAHSLRLIGVHDPGEALTATELKDGLRSLNLMLDSWNVESLMVPARQRVTKTVSFAAYSIGEGADIDVQRPPRLDQGQAFILAIEREYELKVCNDAEWASISNKAYAGIPTAIYFDGANLNLYPVPSGQDLVLYLPVLLAQLGNDDTVQMPMGYYEAITYNLAVRLAPEYLPNDRRIRPEVVVLATETKANIKRMNYKPLHMQCDVAVCNPNMLSCGLAYDIKNG